MGAREFGWWTDFLEKNKVKGVSKDVWDLVGPSVQLRLPRLPVDV